MSTKIQTRNARARLIRIYGSSRNETHTWEVSVRGGSTHVVRSSRVFNPPETFVFPADAEIEIAGGAGESHDSAMRSYLNSLG